MRLGRQPYQYFDAAAGQVRGRFQRIAAVVAGAGQHQYAPVARVAFFRGVQQLQGGAGGGLARALHQQPLRQVAHGGLFDGAQFGDGIQGKGGAGKVGLGHGAFQ